MIHAQERRMWMITERIPILVGTKPTEAVLQTYFMDASDELFDSDKRPAILLMPGGAYRYTSDREAEPIALRLNAMGYQVAVLRYSCAPAAFPQALWECAAAFRFLKDNAAEYNIDKKRILTMGFSAGGHLAASLGIYWNHPLITEVFQDHTLRPYAQILCYPVITAGVQAHEESFRNLLQEDYDKPEMRELVSLERQVHRDVPRTFIWHTHSDPTVPVANSLLFASALVKAGVLCEFHMYDKGPHGLATAGKLTRRSDGEKLQPECESWLSLLETWLNSL